MNKKILAGIATGLIAVTALTGLSGCNKSSKPELGPEESSRSKIHSENRLYINKYEMDMNVDDEGGVLSYSVTAEIENNTQDTLDEIIFRNHADAFVQNSASSGVSAAYLEKDKSSALTFTQDENDSSIIKVALGENKLEPGGIVKITLDVQEPIIEGDPHLGVLSPGKYKEYVFASCFVRVAEYREGGWILDSHEKQEGESVAFDDLSQASDYTVTIHAPSGYKAIGTGVESKDEDDVIHLDAVDSRDFAVVLSNGFRSYFWSNNNLNVSYYYIEGSKLYEESQTAAGSSATLGLDWASYYFGAYPWNQYDIVQLYSDCEPESYPGIMTYGGKKVYDGIPLGELAEYSTEMKSLFGKEVLNEWFYEITQADPNKDGWLAEGFKTWFEDFTSAKVYGQTKDREIKRIIEKAKEEHPKEMAMKLSDEFPDRATADIVYKYRGAEFLELIYKELGEEEFLAFIKDYMEDYRLKETDTEGFLERLRKHDKGDVLTVIDEFF